MPTDGLDENGLKLWLEKVWLKHPGGILEKSQTF
jgi:hypothetical protein